MAKKEVSKKVLNLLAKYRKQVEDFNAEMYSRMEVREPGRRTGERRRRRRIANQWPGFTAGPHKTEKKWQK